jgi:hypothetical protein
MFMVNGNPNEVDPEKCPVEEYYATAHQGYPLCDSAGQMQNQHLYVGLAGVLQSCHIWLG